MIQTLCAEADGNQEPTSPDIDLRIARARGALADGLTPIHNEARVDGNEPLKQLLDLLWHERSDVRRTAALALAGGDRSQTYRPPYGHFAGSFLRRLPGRGETPCGFPARHAAVVEALREMLSQSALDIRAMSNMHYSFLSSALYLALLFTCRDALESARRLRASALHPELCRLLSELTHCRALRRLNPKDADVLVQSAALALAAMPPDEITEFWRRLRHDPRPHRLAYLSAVAHLQDRSAVPHLLHALADQPEEIAQPLVDCLGRIGDARALTALTHLARERNRTLRQAARSAIAAIQRNEEGRPARTLLRPVRLPGDPRKYLLRPAGSRPDDMASEMLRPSGAGSRRTAPMSEDADP